MWFNNTGVRALLCRHTEWRKAKYQHTKYIYLVLHLPSNKMQHAPMNAVALRSIVLAAHPCGFGRFVQDYPVYLFPSNLLFSCWRED